jgi:type III secretory pathway component EscS
MIDAQIYDLLIEALRCLFLYAVPAVAAVAVAGSLVAVLQSATSIKEPALNYGARLLALVLVLYLMLAAASQNLLSLTELAFR